MSEALKQAKQEVLKGCRLTCEKNFTVGTAGNISARVLGEDRFVITPTSMDYNRLTEEDLVVIDMDGHVVEGKWKPSIEHNLHRYGMMARCARVRSSEVAVLELEHAGSDACNRISAEIDRAMLEDRAEAIVLGCAGMADLAGRLAKQHGLPVLDGVSCAVKLAEAMVGLGLRTSRLGGYAPPPVQKLRATG